MREWRGSDARALRTALRKSVRVFAAELGVAARTVSKWEHFGADTCPRPDTQAILDTALAKCDPATQLRFELLVTEGRRRPAHWSGGRSADSAADYESWTEDIERANAALSRQNFGFAGSLLNRWLQGRNPHSLDDHGRYLHARATTVLGDLRRDQGAVLGPMSAELAYTHARSVFEQLDNARRVAQLDLALAVVTEMSGALEPAAEQYELLAGDDRLSPRDQARARLWIGTALTKHGDYDYAAGVMTAAAHDFEDLDESDDWAVAQQKLALAYRGSGKLTDALRCIAVARTTGGIDSPMQQVRIDTAHAHILLTDPATAQEGLTVLDQTGAIADRYGMSHQRRSIDNIRQTYEQAATQRNR